MSRLDLGFFLLRICRLLNPKSYVLNKRNISVINADTMRALYAGGILYTKEKGPVPSVHIMLLSFFWFFYLF